MGVAMASHGSGDDMLEQGCALRPIQGFISEELRECPGSPTHMLEVLTGILEVSEPGDAGDTSLKKEARRQGRRMPRVFGVALVAILA